MMSNYCTTFRNASQERRYEIRRASTLVGGETKYQINMTLIAHSRIPKNNDRPLAEVTRAAMTARSFQHPGLCSLVVRLCPNVYHTSEYILDLL